MANITLKQSLSNIPGITQLQPGAGLTTNGSYTIVNANTGIVANTLGTFVNSAYIATVTVNTANNSTYLAGQLGSYYAANSQLANYQTTAGLSANVATLASNSATYANASVSNTFTVGTGSYFVSNGNVGIGTTTPASKLDVNGQITVPDQLAYDYTTSVLPDVAPALNLNFVQSKVVDPRITFTRSSTATFVGSNGLIQTAAVNTPRFDYDPVTRAPKGLLIEEQRTNLTTYSGDPTNAVWAVNAVAKTSTNNSDPSGTSTALLATADGTNTTHYVRQGLAISFTSGTAYTQSIWAKAGTVDRLQLTFGSPAFGNSQYANFYLSGAGSVTASTGGTATISQYANGWYRLTFTATATATTSVQSIFVLVITSGTDPRLPSNTSSGTFYLYGAQVEAGAFATSYIPTVASQVTRTADVASMTGTNFSQWYNQSEGTFVVDAQKTSPSGTSTYAYDVTGATSSFSLRVHLGVDARMQSIDGGVVQVDTQIATPVPTTPSKYALAYKLNDYAGSANGATVATDSSATVPSLSALNIGSPTVTNIHIRSIQYYNTRLANTVLQGITA